MLTEFTVDRGSWLQGEGAVESLLLRFSDGKKCCLGFMCLAAGFSEASIMGLRLPLSLKRDVTVQALLPMLPAVFFASYDERTEELMGTNDAVDLERAEREDRLILGFKNLGIELTFTGSY